MHPEQFQNFANKVIANCGKVIVGKDEVIRQVAVTFLCGGHVLLEDVPGTGKTMLFRAFARACGGHFKRIQFTPDVVPSDITGFSIANFKTGELEYRPGMIMSQIVLADEINRTSPKTQSALLEAMEDLECEIKSLQEKYASDIDELDRKSDIIGFAVESNDSEEVKLVRVKLSI